MTTRVVLLVAFYAAIWLAHGQWRAGYWWCALMTALLGLQRSLELKIENLKDPE
jgi:hypothetical protein